MTISSFPHFSFCDPAKSVEFDNVLQFTVTFSALFSKQAFWFAVLTTVQLAHAIAFVQCIFAHYFHEYMQFCTFRFYTLKKNSDAHCKILKGENSEQ